MLTGLNGCPHCSQGISAFGVLVVVFSSAALVGGEVSDRVGVAADESDPEHGVMPPEDGGDDEQRPDEGEARV